MYYNETHTVHSKYWVYAIKYAQANYTRTCTHNLRTYWKEISHMHSFTAVKLEEVFTENRCFLSNSQE